MPIVVSYNSPLELAVFEYSGHVTLAELKAMMRFHGQNPEILRCDCLTVLHPGSHLTGIDADALRAILMRFRRLFAPFDFQIMRRSAWVCQSPKALAHARLWVDAIRDTAREEMSSAIRLFDSFTEAADWLLLNPDDLNFAERRDKFAELARIDWPLRANAFAP